MLPFVLRRCRAQLWTLTGSCVVLVAVLVLHGNGIGSDLDAVTAPGRYAELSRIFSFLPLATLMIGVFWGAPLVSRELELQTSRFIWAQPTGRHRWYFTHVGVLSTIVIVLGAVLGLTISWWLGRFAGHDLPGVGDDPSLLGARGLALIGWWWLALGLGTLAGAVLRRTLAAMAVSTVALLVAMFVVQLVVGLPADPSGAIVTIAVGLSICAVLCLVAAWMVVRRAAA